MKTHPAVVAEIDRRRVVAEAGQIIAGWSASSLWWFICLLFILVVLGLGAVMGVPLFPSAAPGASPAARPHLTWTRFRNSIDGNGASSVRPELRARFVTPAIRSKLNSQKATLFAVMLGRAAGCGLSDTPEFGRKFGGWMMRNFPPSIGDKDNPSLALTVVSTTAARLQREGKSPATCESVAQFFVTGGPFQTAVQ
jgi:hypothetical protein